MPSRVVLFDERGFLRPGPTFDLFLSCDCLGRSIVQFVKDKLIYGITFGKAVNFFGFVLLHSLLEIPVMPVYSVRDRFASSLSDFVRKSFVFNTTRVYVEKYSIET